MSASGPWRAPAGLWGSLACGLAAGGDGRCWRSVSSGVAPPRLCRALAECIDTQLAAFGHGWPQGSIQPLAAVAGDLAQPLDPYVVDVLRPDASLVASFACPLEAVRYAALLHEPGRAPLLRRRWDGGLKAFSPTAPVPAALRWLKLPGLPE
jgi:hypothetical protein